MKFILSTNNNLESALILTAALENAKRTYTEYEFSYHGNFQEVFENNPFISKPAHADSQTGIFVSYSPFSTRTGDGGLLTEGFSTSLGLSLRNYINSGIDIYTLTPSVFLTKKELDGVKLKTPYVVIDNGLNENYETRSYPHWKNIIASMPEVIFVILGVDNDNGIAYDFKNVINLRKTTIRQYFAIIAKAKAVLAAPGASVHAAAALNIPCVEIAGALESTELTCYQNVKVFASGCCGNPYYSWNNGCTLKKINTRYEHDKCECIVKNNGIKYASCMNVIKPEEIVSCLKQML